MSEEEVHELAVAFAQAKLLATNSGNKDNSNDISGSDSEEVYEFVKMYRFALNNIPTEWKRLD